MAELKYLADEIENLKTLIKKAIPEETLIPLYSTEVSYKISNLIDGGNNVVKALITREITLSFNGTIVDNKITVAVEFPHHRLGNVEGMETNYLDYLVVNSVW